MCVFRVMEVGAKFTHRALLPPTGRAQNRNPPTHAYMCVCAIIILVITIIGREIRIEK